MGKDADLVASPEATPVRATRHFDQLVKKQRVVVDLSDDYWANHLRAGNIVVIDDGPRSFEEIIVDWDEGDLLDESIDEEDEE